MNYIHVVCVPLVACPLHTHTHTHAHTHTQRDDLLRDVDDYKSQVQWQAQSLSSSQQGGAGAGHYKDLLRSKDRKLNETLDEVEVSCILPRGG